MLCIGELAHEKRLETYPSLRCFYIFIMPESRNLKQKSLTCVFHFILAPLPNLTSEDIDRALAPSVVSSASYASKSLTISCLKLILETRLVF